MHKLSEFVVSPFDPSKETSDKERGIKFWYDHINELKILQKNGALDLKNPYSGIQKFMHQKNIINMAEKQSEWEFLPHKKDINREDSKQLLDTLIGMRNAEETKKALKKVYFDQENFEIFRKILIREFTTTNNLNDLLKIVECGAQSTQDLKLEELQAKKTEFDKELSKAEPDYVPIEVKDNKQYKIKDGNKELEAIRDFEGAGDLKLTTETCVRDWLIDGGYDHDFTRCKPQGAVEYNEKDKYGWNTNGEEFVSRYRQNTVFGVPVLFDQNMVFDQAIPASAVPILDKQMMESCFLRICSEILGVFKHEDTWYYKTDAKQFLKYTIKDDDMTFFYGETILN